jgi:catechol 2,3-dioxygenase-like lactoylglutathione lyase family enzyme
MSGRVDHLVVAAASLEQGVAWCRETLGVEPGPGGEHPLMGTHNRLLRVATVDYPRAYFEIIAIQPGKAPQQSRRWFDLDDEAMQAALKQDGPRLVHFVASVPDVRAAVAAWRALGIDRGEPVRTSRMTPRGLLEWQITVRPDGQRLRQGMLPAFIEWGEAHPAAHMPESGVTLQAVCAYAPDPAPLRSAYEAIGLQGVAVKEGPPNLCSVLETPRGRVKLESKGL